jgi:hypothetical protein
LHVTVLDCANGYQKENQDQADEVEQNLRQKTNSGEATGKETEDFQEVGEEQGCSEKND